MMTDHRYNVLFLCTGNSARSLAEALLNYWGKGRFQAFSAGSHPKGQVHPLALEILRRNHLPTEHLRSKSWEEFATADAPPLDFVFTVCDNAAQEVCPIWPGQPMTAHWGIHDPAAVEGSDEEKERAFNKAFRELDARLKISRVFDSLKEAGQIQVAEVANGAEVSRDVPSAPPFFQRDTMSDRELERTARQYAGHSDGTERIVAGQAVVTLLERRGTDEAGIQAVEVDALTRILRGQFDKAAAHPSHRHRVVEEERSWIARRDATCLDTVLRKHHNLRFDRDLQGIKHRAQIAGWPCGPYTPRRACPRRTWPETSSSTRWRYWCPRAGCAAASKT